MTNTTDPKIVLIAAYAEENRVIGVNNKLPWKLPTDLKHFKSVTRKHPMIMGSNTWRSLGNKALPGRMHYVVTSDINTLSIREADTELVVPVYTIEAGLMLAYETAVANGLDSIYVIGGASLYRQCIDRSSKMILTVVENKEDTSGVLAIQGDTVFPEFSLDEWELVSVETPSVQPKEIPFRIETYARKPPVA